MGMGSKAPIDGPHRFLKISTCTASTAQESCSLEAVLSAAHCVSLQFQSGFSTRTASVSDAAARDHLLQFSPHLSFGSSVGAAAPAPHDDGSRGSTARRSACVEPLQEERGASTAQRTAGGDPAEQGWAAANSRRFSCVLRSVACMLPSLIISLMSLPTFSISLPSISHGKTNASEHGCGDRVGQCDAIGNGYSTRAEGTALSIPAGPPPV